MNLNIIYPDYNNSIANLANSIMRKWGLPTNGGTLKLLDSYLTKDYKNAVVILLDGMGKCIIECNLEENGFFNTHLAGTYSSTFPPTTVAATTSIDNGLTPCEHGWLGWDCYYPQIDRNVTVFFNTDTETGEEVAEGSVAWKYCGYSSVINRINSAGGKAYYVSTFVPPYPGSFEESCRLIKEDLIWCLYFHRYVEKKHGIVKGSLIVSIIWAFWHAPIWFLGTEYSGTALLQYIAEFVICIASLGFMIGICYHRCKNLFVPIWMHYVFNFFGRNVCRLYDRFG